MDVRWSLNGRMYRAAARQRVLARIGAGTLFKPRLKDGFAVANGRAQGMRIDLDELGAGAIGAPAFEGVGFHADTFGSFGSRQQLGCCGHFGQASDLAVWMRCRRRITACRFSTGPRAGALEAVG